MHPVVTTIEALCKAMVEADPTGLERYASDSLSYGHTSGIVESKDEFLRAIVGEEKRDDFKWITVSDHSIIEDSDVVIARHRFQAEVFVNGSPMHPDIRVVQVWKKAADGTWKLIVRQAFKTPS